MKIFSSTVTASVAEDKAMNKSDDFSSTSNTGDLWDGSEESLSTSSEDNLVEVKPTSCDHKAKSPVKYVEADKTRSRNNGEYYRKVTVVGNGYVGLPLAVLMKDQGHQVIGFDANQERVESHN